MKQRFSINDIVHHIGVAASAQRIYADEIGNKQLASQFTRQAEQADAIAEAFITVDNADGPADIYLDGDQLVVEVA